MPNYYKDAVSDAKETAENFLDEIIEQLLDKGKASDDLNNDYEGGDSYHHESHVDKYYNLKDAAELLDDLSDYEETDSGLWEGQLPRDAISTQAAYTYGMAVWSLWSDLVEVINDDDEISSLIADFNAVYESVDGQLQDDLERADKEHADDAGWVYEPPFKRDDEVEKRQDDLINKIKARVEQICASFDG